jgi:hypothetical protein
MKTFESIRRFVVPANVVTETDAQLRDAGTSQVERFVLWSGVADGEVFHVRTAHVPEQTAYRLARGLCVRVGGDALHRLNVWLFEAHEQLAVQVHSHPTDAYHSDTDDTFPIVTTRGGLSVVVPDFGRDGLRGPGVACYRLNATGWQELDDDEADKLIQFTGR